MANEEFKYGQLLRYPVIAASIFLAFIVADKWLGIDFSRITKIGPQGLELQEQRKDTIEAIQSIDEQLKNNKARIELLESKLLNLGVTISAAEKKKAISSAQEVSAQVAQLARPIEEGQKSLVYGKTGYIWVGNYNTSEMKWEKILLVRLDGQLESMSPNNIKEGTKYSVAQSIVLRDGLPPNDENYFLDRKNLGLIPNGTEIQILGSPEPIDREFAVQYWAKIKVLE